MRIICALFIWLACVVAAAQEQDEAATAPDEVEAALEEVVREQVEKETVIIDETTVKIERLVTEEEERKPATLEELKAAIAELVAERELPAVGIAMVDRSGPVWVGAIGKANLEADIGADEDTLFRIGSTSKMFVSLAALKLVEEGRLSLDDKLSDLAPEIEYRNPWEDTDPIRIVHLLEHTTGWDDIHLPEFAHNNPTPVTLKEAFEFHPHSRSSRWIPGTRSSYCNAGPPVVAYIIEKVTGQDFEDYVRGNFFDPLGMDSTSYRLTDEVRKRGATLYANGNQPQEYWHISMRPSGAINSSARDMAGFVAFYLNRGAVDGRQLVSRGSLERMESVGSTTAARLGQQTGYGLSNYSSTHESWSYREHGGGVIGGLTELAYLAEAGVGHVIMTNSDDFRTFRDISELVRDFETRELAPGPRAEPVAISADHRKIEGLYAPINSRQQMGYFLDRVFGIQKLWLEDDKLRARALLGGDTNDYYPVSATLYASDKTGLTALTLAQDPLAGEVVHAGTLVMKPVSAPLAYAQIGIAALWGIAIVTSVLYFFIWVVRRWRGRIPAGATMRIRTWPLLASVSAIVVVLLVARGASDPFRLLGQPSAVSVGISLALIAFAFFAAFGAWTSIEERAAKMNRANYWHSTIASFLHLVVAAYLLWFGVIGSVTWA